MRLDLHVARTSIDFQDRTLEITDTREEKHTLPFDHPIHVTMVGYPDREEKDLKAEELEPYMSSGYIIEKISFDEKKA